MDIRSIQKPLKDEYRRNPAGSRITLTAKAPRIRHRSPARWTSDAQCITRSPQRRRWQRCGCLLRRSAARGTGGLRAADLSVGCCGNGSSNTKIEVTVNGDMDLQGTLGLSKSVPVGFESIRVDFRIDAPKRAPTVAVLAGKDGTILRCAATMLHPRRLMQDGMHRTRAKYRVRIKRVTIKS
jgi:hypothetical protein